MAFDERKYIEVCRKQIEKKFAFGGRQRDLELLSRHIEEKTGISLSLSTLKRLWKGDFKERPQVATLNALAIVLDYRDWQDFKMRNQLSARRAAPRKGWMLSAALLSLAILVTAILSLNKRESSTKVQINGPVVFTADKTVTSGTPNTVIFTYDVSNVRADSFFIQQSWNPSHKQALDREGNTLTSIYYEPGYHRARLMAGDSVIAMQPVHILSDGWEPHVYYSYAQDFIHFRGENFITKGRLYLDRDLLHKRKVDLSRHFFTRIGYSEEFEVSSDNFSLVSRIKTDSMSGKSCPVMQVMIVTERHIFWVRLQNKGCERFAGYKMGEVVRTGENNDLSALGVNIYNWQEIGISVKNKTAEIRINGQLASRKTFHEDFGEIKGLNYIFDGTGSIDYVLLTDGKGQTVFEDNFTRPPQ